MYLVLSVLLQRTKIPQIIPLWRARMDFCSDGLSYSSFFESFLAGDEKIMPARGRIWRLLVVFVAWIWVSCRYKKEGEQIYCDIQSIFPL